MIDRIDVLGDGIGFVRLEDAMGGDNSVVRAARVSYGSVAGDEAKDRKLIAYLLNHDHGSPFEHNAFTFHVKAPITVFRQWHRHRVGHSYNEASYRYKPAPEEFYFPKEYRLQDQVNKQSSTGALPADLAAEFDERVREANRLDMEIYRDMIAAGVAREVARLHLGVDLYSEMYTTLNARSMMHFVGLRSHHHAQAEIRQYSDAMFRIWAERMPWTATAFVQSLWLPDYPGLTTWAEERGVHGRGAGAGQDVPA